MENVLAAFVTIFLLLFSALTLSAATLSSQDALSVSWQAMQARADLRTRTSLTPIRSQAINDTSVLAFVYRNDGKTRLADFAKWDLIVQYHDSGNPAAYYAEWLPYSAAAPADNQWTVEGIYQDAERKLAEVIEPGIVNPGEELAIQIKLFPPLGIGKTIEASLTTSYGMTATALFTPDAPPVLAANTGLIVAVGGSVTIKNTQLSVTDADDQPGQLVYTVTTAPTQGTLNLGSTFTQLAVDNGALKYSHTGSGNDSFGFTVTDGKTTIGPFTVTITTNQQPVLAANTGLTVPSGQTMSIGNTQLAVTDVDDPASNLVFTVVTSPAHGTLSLGNTFTQAAIDNGLLAYARTGDGGDSFTFTVSDGHSTIGPYTFTIVQP